jgi:hypothetical protein
MSPLRGLVRGGNSLPTAPSGVGDCRCYRRLRYASPTVNRVSPLQGLACKFRRLRAESPAINSTGQRPVKIERISHASPERAESGRKDYAPPGLLENGWLSFRRATPSRVRKMLPPLCRRHNMLVENEISRTIPPPVPSGTECVTGNIVPFSLFYPHSVPNGTGRRTTTRIFYQHVVPDGTRAAFSSEHDRATPCE